MLDVGRHPNIQLFTYSEVVDLRGKAGNFTATILKHPTSVDESLCTGCGECAVNCPIVVPNEFDCGLGARKAIYRSFVQAVPNFYVRDITTCINKDFHNIRCHHCEKACLKKAINYDQPPREIRVPVGSVIVAIGADVFDPYDMKAYGYSVSENIVTGLEFERLLNASGPTRGKILRPSDKKEPRTIAFIQCVGVRGESNHYYCSRFCCMNSLKDALLVKEHQPGIEKITIFYSDLRCFGKGYESLYHRTLERPEIAYFRGKPSKIIEDSEKQNLVLHVENTLTGRPEKLTVEMVVLASAAVPPASAQKLAGILGIALNEAGFFASRPASGDILSSTREGIYLCGCARGPEDIPDSVAQGSGAAALAEKYVQEARLPEPDDDISQIDTDGPPRIGVFLCHCGINIGGVLDIEGMQEYARSLPGVVHVQNDLFLCADSGQKDLQQKIVEKRLNRVVAAACTPRTHEPIFQKTLARIGLNPYLFEMVNVRDQCSWVHATEPELATRRAKDQIRMAVSRAHWLEPLSRTSIAVERAVLVIGGGISGIESALTLDAQGIPVYLLEKKEKLGGKLTELHQVLPDYTPAKEILNDKIAQLNKSKVEVRLNSQVTGISGFIGNFDVKTSQGDLRVGAIIVAPGSDVYHPQNEYGYGKIPNVMTNLELEQKFLTNGQMIQVTQLPVQNVAFIQCVGSREPEKNPHCSRICCDTTIKQALKLREQGANVVVFYRDMRAVGHGVEELYRKARGMGILFIRFPDDKKPRVKKAGTRCKISVLDSMLGEEVELTADVVVLATGLAPDEQEMEKFREMLKIPRSQDGFFMERHPKLGPVETVVEGVFICGTVQSPKGIGDSIAQANAAAAKAINLVNSESLELSPTTCVVDENKCRGCGMCVTICDYHAPVLVEKFPGVFVAEINEAICKGCGTCAAWCETDAITARHFTDTQIESMLETMLLEVA